MELIAFVNAYYIKLGRAGAWEADAIAAGKLRFGWRGRPSRTSTPAAGVTSSSNCAPSITASRPPSRLPT